MDDLTQALSALNVSGTAQAAGLTGQGEPGNGDATAIGSGCAGGRLCFRPSTSGGSAALADRRAGRSDGIGAFASGPPTVVAGANAVADFGPMPNGRAIEIVTGEFRLKPDDALAIARAG